MSDLKFTLGQTTKKPTRKYRKGSKYDPVLEAIQKSTGMMGTIEIPNIDGNYIRTQLKKRIDALKVTNIKLSVVNNQCYYEKIVNKKAQPEKVETPKKVEPPTPN